MLQRSEEWLEMRRGRFTASDISRLLGKENLKSTQKSIETFALEKAIEQVYGIDDDEFFVSIDMQKGIDREPFAFDYFRKKKELEFLTVEPCFFYQYGEHAGASPDGIVSDGSVLEIKCPRKKTFFEVVRSNYIDPKYMAQMQMQMLCTGLNKAYYFNYIIIGGIEYHHEIIVERDDEFIQILEERLLNAIELKKEIIKQIKK
jgi:putative phage-type endonuclease